MDTVDVNWYDVGVERFWSKVDMSGDCWLWKAYRNKRGYGYFATNGKQGLAHRKSWELAKGPVPNGMLVCHKCDNPSCVRPDHLFLGTQRDNMQDCSAKGRIVPPIGSRSGRTALNEEQVQVMLMLHDGGASPRALARSFEVTLDIVRNIVNGRTWRHVS